MYNPRYSQRQMYNYSGPTTAQYESFFDPIPLEFVERNLQTHQGKYDTSYAAALTAKDLYAGAQVADTDIANKNNLVNEFTGNMDKMVTERYGGDWGRAAKDVARHVTDMRTNPFWDTTTILQKRQNEERELRAKYGPNALIYNSVLDRSSIDPETGKVLTADQLSYDIQERGDWAGSIDQILSRMKPSTNTWGLSSADFGYLRSGKTQFISEEGIRKIAEDPSVQQAILSQNPDMIDAFTRLPEERAKWFGKEYEDDQLSNAIADMIKGRGKSMVFSQSDDQYYQNWMLKSRMENQPEMIDPFLPLTESEGMQTGYATSEDYPNYSSLWTENGSINENTDNRITETERRLQDLYYTDIDGKRIVIGEAREAYEKALEENAESIKQEKNKEIQQVRHVVSNLRDGNPELTKNMSDREVYEDFLENVDKYKVSMNMIAPVGNRNIHMNVGRAVAGNINGTSFYTLDGNKVTNNWEGESGLEELTNLSVPALQSLLVNGHDTPIGYDYTRGSLMIELPIIKGSLNLTSEGRIDYGKTKVEDRVKVYFSPDLHTRGASQLIPLLDRLVKEPSSREELKQSLPPTIQLDESRLNMLSGDVNDQEVFLMRDQDGQLQHYSLNELRGYYFNDIRQHLTSNYHKVDKPTN